MVVVRSSRSDVLIPVIEPMHPIHYHALYAPPRHAAKQALYLVLLLPLPAVAAAAAAAAAAATAIALDLLVF